MQIFYHTVVKSVGTDGRMITSIKIEWCCVTFYWCFLKIRYYCNSKNCPISRMWRIWYLPLPWSCWLVSFFFSSLLFSFSFFLFFCLPIICFFTMVVMIVYYCRYSFNDSKRWQKTALVFTGPVFLDTTGNSIILFILINNKSLNANCAPDWGELLPLLNASYLQGTFLIFHFFLNLHLFFISFASLPLFFSYFLHRSWWRIWWRHSRNLRKRSVWPSFYVSFLFFLSFLLTINNFDEEKIFINGEVPQHSHLRAPQPLPRPLPQSLWHWLCWGQLE